MILILIAMLMGQMIPLDDTTNFWNSTDRIYILDPEDTLAVDSLDVILCDSINWMEFSDNMLYEYRQVPIRFDTVTVSRNYYIKVDTLFFETSVIMWNGEPALIVPLTHREFP